MKKSLLALPLVVSSTASFAATDYTALTGAISPTEAIGLMLAAAGIVAAILMVSVGIVQFFKNAKRAKAA